MGKGLGALLSDISFEGIDQTSEEVVKQLAHTVAMIPIEIITSTNDAQPRVDFNEEALAELAASIRAHGLIQPITVRRLDAENYQIISGERRLRASKMAGLTEMPAYIRLANDQEMMEMALVENIQRQDLNAVEVASTYARLKEEFGLTDEKLAERVGKGRATITNFLRLLKLPDDELQALKRSDISVGHAKELMGLDGKDDLAFRKALFHKILDDGISVRSTEQIIRDYKAEKDMPSKKTVATKLPPAYKSVEDKLKSHFGKKINIKLKGNGKGQIVVPFTSDDDLNDFLERINLL